LFYDVHLDTPTIWVIIKRFVLSKSSIYNPKRARATVVLLAVQVPTTSENHVAYLQLAVRDQRRLYITDNLISRQFVCFDPFHKIIKKSRFVKTQ